MKLKVYELAIEICRHFKKNTILTAEEFLEICERLGIPEKEKEVIE